MPVPGRVYTEPYSTPDKLIKIAATTATEDAMELETEQAPPQEFMCVNCELVLHCHRVGVGCFLAGNSLKSSQHAAIVVFVGLECRSALVACVVPRDPYIVLFGFG